MLRLVAVWLGLGLWFAAPAAAQDGPAMRAEVVPVRGSLAIEAPLRWGGLTVFPVIDAITPANDEATRPLHLAEALASGTVRLTEISSGGSVARLLVHNVGARPVLVLAGDVVQGGRQDRIIAEDLLLSPTERPVVVAVNCVEEGRWEAGRSAFRYGGRAEPALTRVVLTARDQEATWRAVTAVNDAKRERLGAMGVDAPELAPTTGTYMASLGSDEVSRQARKVAHELGGALAKLDHAVGVVVAYEGRVVAAEIFGSPALFAAARERALESVALQALSTGSLGGTARPSAEIAAAFLADTLDAVGEDQRREVVGATTVGFAVRDADGQVVRHAAFSR